MDERKELIATDHTYFQTKGINYNRNITSLRYPDIICQQFPKLTNLPLLKQVILVSVSINVKLLMIV